MDGTAIPVLSRIIELTNNKRRVVVAIDGRCASGKTTLADALSERLGCAVFHTDDFFLRPEQRTPERFAEPGGNMDRERLRDEVILPLERGEKTVVHRAYDCKTGTMTPPVETKVGNVAIVEGSYICHPDLRDHFDLRVFLTVSTEEQMRRITAREGEAAAEVFGQKWIPLEEEYFKEYRIAERCDLCFSTDVTK
ncbi:MAG: AAA family ATPase [Clostridia bacterium]|nr:AAA family ATPase [Clostridia bacterium]